jgi:hypothetical protein
MTAIMHAALRRNRRRVSRARRELDLFDPADQRVALQRTTVRRLVSRFRLPVSTAALVAELAGLTREGL